MSDSHEIAAPPYASFSSLINFINKLRDTGIPSRIDPTVFGNASGSLSYSVIAALKSLKLIGADGIPSDEFASFVAADDEARKPALLAALRVGYPTLWNGTIKLETATAGQFDEHIRQEYDVKGSTVDKVATFFIAAANYAGVPLSTHLKARKPVASSSSARKSSKQRKVDPPETNERPPAPSSIPPAQTHHPFVQGLLDTLPKTGDFPEWSIDQQAEWLEAAAGNLRLLSKQKGRIKIAVEGSGDGPG